MTGAVLALGIVPLAAGGSAAAVGGELFFSEYVEGSGNNKALEIYNGTGAPVDLGAAGYNVQMFFNGNHEPGLTVQLTETVAAADVYVLAHASSAAAILAAADQSNGSGWFNGDDAVVLRKGTTIVDVIGQIGVDPGSEWGTGLTSTADNTLRRKGAVQAGDPVGSDSFDPAAQWDGLATDTFAGLGTHPPAAPDIEPTLVSTNPAADAENVPATGSLTVTFSEAVTASGAFALACAGNDVPVRVSGGGATYTIDPEGSLPYATQCVLTIEADRVTDQDGEPDNLGADAVVDFGTTSRPGSCDDAFTRAHAIQGSGPSAAVTGTVTTAGVVVGDYEGRSGLSGFYVQDLAGDGDPSTSDALFVYNFNDTEVSLGDVVRVRGWAEENFGQTQVDAFDDGVAVCDAGAAVAPTAVELPFADEADRERYEGMLVQLPQTLSVTELFQLGRFGQVTLSSGGRLAQPTNVVAPGAEANALQASNDLNRIILDDGSNGQNPDPIVFGRGGEPLSAQNTLRGGDTATGTVGVMTYTWGGASASPNAYRVRPVNALGGHAELEAVNQRTAGPEEVGGDVRVASFNVLNYFNSFSGCRAGCRGANNQAELDRQAAKIVAALQGLEADVVGVIEIENDGYATASALADLTRRLNEQMGAGTYRYLDVDERTGQTDALGDDAIKVGMLYRPASVRPVARTAVLNTDSFVNGASGAPRNRPALAQSFEEVDGGGRFTAVVNHLKSKGSDCDEDGDPDTGDGQGNCNQTRLESAQELATWLQTDPTQVGDTDVLVMGDLNSYAKEDPIAALREAGFTDLVRRLEGKASYSYVFDGQWGYLDHALASPHLARQVTGTTTWHINADEPTALDYNTEFKTAGLRESLYAATPYRSSDHDPVLVGLDLAPSKPGADDKRR